MNTTTYVTTYTPRHGRPLVPEIAEVRYPGVCQMEDLPGCTGENVTRRVNAYNLALHSDDAEYLICDGCDEHLRYLVATDGES